MTFDEFASARRDLLDLRDPSAIEPLLSRIALL